MGERGFAGGLFLGLAAGCVAGVAAAFILFPPLSPKRVATPVPVAAKPNEITLGRPAYYAGVTTYPVVLKNNSGQAKDFLAVHCAFYNAAGSIVTTGDELWSSAKPGANAGHITLTNAKPSEIKRADCREG